MKIRKRVEDKDAINFLEGLEHDIPSGSWSLKVDKKKVWRLLFEEVDGLKIIFDEQTLCKVESW